MAYRDSPPITTEEICAVSGAVSVGVEFIRVWLHPEILTIYPSPYLWLGSGICANVAFQMWTRTDGLLKLAVSSFLSQAGMLVVLTALLKLVLAVASGVLDALSALTA
jgi:hypothetical protein